jgi:hypothetical protein
MYTVWFRDSSVQPEDEDYEWLTCIAVQVTNSHDAKEWGDHLAKKFTSTRFNELFLRSEIEPIENYSGENLETAPRIAYGHEASDEEIGW